MKYSLYRLIGILGFIIIGTALPLLAQNQFDAKFTKVPFQNFADNLVEKVDANVDLTKTFSLSLTGVLDKKGKLDPQKTSYTKVEGDKEMTGIAKKAIEAFNDSGLFSYLADMNVEKTQINFLQNDKNILANIKSELITEARAQSTATGFSILFQVMKTQLIKNPDAQTLLNALKITSNEKFLVIDFVLPKEEAHRILQQELKNRKAAGNLTTKEGNN